MDRGFGPDLVVFLERGPEVDPFDVTEQPRAVMILATLERGDTKRDVKGAALAAETRARRGRCHVGPVEEWRMAGAVS